MKEGGKEGRKMSWRSTAKRDDEVSTPVLSHPIRRSTTTTLTWSSRHPENWTTSASDVRSLSAFLRASSLPPGLSKCLTLNTIQKCMWDVGGVVWEEE